MSTFVPSLLDLQTSKADISASVPSIQGTDNQVYVNGNGSGIPISGTNITLTLPQDLGISSDPSFDAVTVNYLFAYKDTPLGIYGLDASPGVDGTAINIIASSGTVGGSNSSAGGNVSIVGGRGAGSSGASGGNISLQAGDGAPISGYGGDVFLTAGKGRTLGGDVIITGGDPQANNNDGGGVYVTGGSGLGAGTAGNSYISGGNSGTGGVGGNVILSAGTATGGTTGIVQVSTGNFQVSNLTASRLIATDSSNNFTSNVSGLSPGFTGLNLSGLTASSLVATDASKNLVSGNLSGDVTTSNLVSTLATVNSDVGTFGDGTHVSQVTVNAKGLITAVSSVAITGAPPTGSAGNDLSGTYPNPIVARINGAALGVMSATSGNIPIGSGSQWVTRAVSGDGTITSTGTLTITKTNGVSFAASATTDTTNAANISSGTLPSGRISGSYTGITAVGTLTGLTMSNNTASALFNISSTLTGSSNSVGVAISRGDAANGFADVYFKTGSTFNYEIGMQAGDSLFYLIDIVNSANIFVATPGSGTTGSVAFGGTVTVAANLKINTAGKTLYIKQGSNACSGTGAVLVGGTVTVSTTAVATGDIILLNCTAAGGTQGVITTSINNGVSFTLTSSSGTDTSTYSWVIIKAA